MKSVLFATTLLAATAVAKPLDKRYYVTETNTITVTIYETLGQTTPTANAGAGAGGWGNWGSWSSASTPPPSPASPAPTGSPSPAPPAGSGAPDAYASAMLEQHNIHRSNHSASPLVWDSDLAGLAQQVAQSCVYAHDTSVTDSTIQSYGQNIGAGYPASTAQALITDLMYNDEMENYAPYYGEATPGGDSDSYGHFTQIVWKGSQSLGCYTQDCTQGLSGVQPGVEPYFTVCNYYPVGNFLGEYASNVSPPLGQPYVSI